MLRRLGEKGSADIREGVFPSHDWRAASAGWGARRSEIRQESVDATCYELSHLGDVIIPRCETKSTFEGKETMHSRACVYNQFISKTRSLNSNQSFEIPYRDIFILFSYLKDSTTISSSNTHCNR
ncbi:hypothetical protein NPIL_404821 [Nephila pilipes]|uniref:Uncharacterized protein n=1 Tax=Nephila pilipes TaxID=299642 RepID=A0A8X6MYM2_NEPPI|nr:hypothetical protein NPIL_404821 [Nephila pilipes]